MKARRLKRLRVKRVDLVERGANQGADVVLFKAEDGNPADLTTCQKCNTRVSKGAKTCPNCGAAMPMEAAKAAKERQMAENTEQIVKLQTDLEAANSRAKEAEAKREAVEKSLKEQGEAVAKLQVEVQKARDEASLAKFRKTVDEFEHLPVKADVFAPILKKCHEALDEAGQVELMRVLKAADAASADNFRELGAPGHSSVAQSAAEEIQAKAEELVTKSAGKLDINSAVAQVMASHPKLAARQRRESTASGRQLES